MMKEISTMGSRIREQRKKIGLTQEELAEKLYTKKGTISAYENDRIDIKCSVVKELAMNLECNVQYLIEGKMEGIEVECQDLIKIFWRIKSEKIRSVAMEQLKVLLSI